MQIKLRHPLSQDDELI